MTNAPSLLVNNLTFGFDDRIVLDRLTFGLTAGVYWLQGVNGAGKSTLFKLLARALTPAGGAIALCGQPLAGMSAEQRQAIFLCGDELPRLHWLQGSEFVALYAELYPNIDRIALDLHLERLRLTAALLHSPIMSLSLGERKKLHLAVALSVDANLLLLDEPFNAIDVASASYLRADLQSRVALGKQIVLLTSHADTGLSSGLRIAVLQGGPDSRVVVNDDGNGSN